MVKEHSVFISYKKEDGKSLASWIYTKFNGRSISINSERSILSAQIDLAIPASSDWQKYLDSELEKAASLIIVCSPAATHKYNHRVDYFYHEIEWWLSNRKEHPPLLVTLKEYGYDYIPKIISDNWKNLQVSEIDRFFTENPEHSEANKYTDIFIESISRGITNPYEFSDSKVNLSLIQSPIQNIKGVFAWEKDRFGKYVYANELYARAAGFDSPTSMIGKTDFEMPWRALAENFLEGDRKLMQGDELARQLIFEKEIMVEKVADILVTEGVIKDHSNRIIGVKGSFIDVTAGLTEYMKEKFKENEYGIYLGEAFGNEFLSNLEIEVLKALSLLKDKQKIAFLLNKNIDEIKSIILSIQQKLQCSNEEEILTSVIRAGLQIKLFTHNEKA